MTAAGAREFASRLGSPLTDVAQVNERLDAVAYLAEEPRLRQQLREALKEAPDLARALARLALGRGGPRDLGAVRDAIRAGHALAAHLARAGAGLPAGRLARDRRASRSGARARRAAPSGTLAERLPVNQRDGGFVRDGASAHLHEQRDLRDRNRQVIAGLQVMYADATGIKSLKVRHNNVLGRFRRGHCDQCRGARQATAQRDLHPPPPARQRDGRALDARACAARSAHQHPPRIARSRAPVLESFRRKDIRAMRWLRRRAFP